MTIQDISRKLPITTTLTTLGGDSYFTVTNQNGVVTIINSKGKPLTLDDALVAVVLARYSFLKPPQQLAASQYTDSTWSACKNRVYAPYVARLIDYLQ